MLCWSITGQHISRKVKFDEKLIYIIRIVFVRFICVVHYVFSVFEDGFIGCNCSISVCTAIFEDSIGEIVFSVFIVMFEQEHFIVKFERIGVSHHALHFDSILIGKLFVLVEGRANEICNQHNHENYCGDCGCNDNGLFVLLYSFSNLCNCGDFGFLRLDGATTERTFLCGNINFLSALCTEFLGLDLFNQNLAAMNTLFCLSTYLSLN